jgi:hypothetical protein
MHLKSVCGFKNYPVPSENYLDSIFFIQVQLDVFIFFISFFLDNVAVHASGAICTHHQEHNCSVQP